MATMNYIDKAGTELQELRAVERATENIMASDVTKGMEAYDLSGAWVGTVSEIWAHRPNHGYLPRSQTYLNDYGPIAGTSGWFATTDGYIEVIKPVAPRLSERTHIQLDSVSGIQGDHLLVDAGSAGDRPLARPNRFYGLNV